MNLAQQGQKSTSACPEIIVATNSEYANTQQGLPDQWVYLAHISRHASLLAGGYFAEKHLGLNPYLQCFSHKFYMERLSSNVSMSTQSYWSITIMIKIVPSFITNTSTSFLRGDKEIKALITARHGESIRFNLARWT